MRSWITRNRFILSALLGPALALPAITPAMAQSSRETAALDALFAQLRSALDETAAQAISDQIWIYWTTPDDPALAARMQDVLAMRQRADFGGVIAMLDGIVAEYPTYAEGWNQRATIYFLLGEYEQSLADIDKALKFEPRHFGALVGRAMIYQTQGERALAIKDMAAALAIHPFLAERSMFPELESLTHI